MLNLHPKVQNPAIYGAIVVIMIWLVKVFGSVEMPGEVAGAVTLLIMSGTGYGTSAPQPPAEGKAKS
jgi:hypothetical protein